LLDRFDVVATSEADAVPVLATASRMPIAATALAQLLRLGERLGLHDGLVAESLVYSTLQAGPEFAAWRQANPQRLRALQATYRWSSSTARRPTLLVPAPQQHNAFSRGAARSRRPALRCRTVDRRDPRAAPGVFSSGGDLAGFSTPPDPATALVRSAQHGRGRRVRGWTRVSERRVGRVEPASRTGRRGADAFFQPRTDVGCRAGGTVSLPRRIDTAHRVARLGADDAITARTGVVEILA
jgi:hypothetical protein